MRGLLFHERLRGKCELPCLKCGGKSTSVDLVTHGFLDSCGSHIEHCLPHLPFEQMEIWWYLYLKQLYAVKSHFSHYLTITTFFSELLNIRTTIAGFRAIKTCYSLQDQYVLRFIAHVSCFSIIIMVSYFAAILWYRECTTISIKYSGTMLKPLQLNLRRKGLVMDL